MREFIRYYIETVIDDPLATIGDVILSLLVCGGVYAIYILIASCC